MLTPCLKKKLSIFVEQGGGVIVNGANSNLFDSGYEYIKNFSHISQKSEGKDKSFKIHPANENLRATHVVKHEKDFYLFANEGEHEIMGRITLNKCGKVEKWDAWRGTTEEIAVTATDGNSLEIDIVLKRRESMIYMVDTNQKPAILSKKDKAKTHEIEKLTDYEKYRKILSKVC